MSAPPAIPAATYRLQFSKDFGFRDATALVPYLQALGVSHLYASPFLKARAGSPHGYDLIDYNRLNPEVGDETELAALTDALAARGMGLILDFVPNHMGVAQADNAWWLDVLEWGPASPCADYFDIDWTPAKAALRGRVLLPFLGDHYGRVLEKGELVLKFDAAAGSFGVWYWDHLFPIRPPHYADILQPWLAERRAEGEGGGEALAVLEALMAKARWLRVGNLPVGRRPAVRERAAAFKRELAALARREPKVREAIEAAVAAVNGTPGKPKTFHTLHRLLERQAYRLAFWGAAADEINYRRFFDINDLAGLKMERSELFETAHRLVFRLLREGKLQGLRIDHVDGLFDPKRYCRRLAERAAEEIALGGAPEGTRPYLVVEKILAHHEALRGDWAIDGTTGYETLNLINGLFLHPDGSRGLDRIYRRFAGQEQDFDAVLYDCKRHVLSAMLSSELQVLANELDRISESNWRTRDFTLARLKSALEEVVAAFPVYRTYVDEAGATPEDRRDIDWAVAVARKRSFDRSGSIFDFLHAVLTTDLVRGRQPGYSRRAVVRFAKKFQQFTGPVMAKAMEDTSFYRFVRLISENEVGGDPRRAATSPAHFHQANQERQRFWPGAMLAGSTHDTKRGEDARARLNVLSEMPAAWGRRVRRWASLNRRARGERDGEPLPDRNDEYFLYQTLLGAWPPEHLDPQRLEPADLEAIRARVEGTLTKALREAKRHSSWAHPDEDYEAAARAFLARLLDPLRGRAFLADFLPFAAEIARLGAVNALAQLVLRLTIPGVPDLYQGSELWNLAMVDPDNRRPVDFARRAQLLASLERESAPEAFRALLDYWTDGRVKLLVTARLLALRRRRSALFREGGYLPLAVTGAKAEHLCAFARVAGEEALLVAVPRLPATLMGERAGWPLGEVWEDTAIELPEELAGARWRDAIGGGEAGAPGALALFAALPLAVLVRA